MAAYLERKVAMHGWKAPTHISKPRNAVNCKAKDVLMHQPLSPHMTGTSMQRKEQTKIATPMLST